MITQKLNTIESNSCIKNLPMAILAAVGIGAIVLTALFVPNAVQIFKPFLRKKKRSNYERERIQQAVRSLEGRQLVKRNKRRQQEYIEITKEGLQTLKNLELEDKLKNLELPRGNWDHKWRIVLFDIPEEKGVERRAFQERLKDLGCYTLQRSVFIYPHSCREELDLLISFWGIDRMVYYLEVGYLGGAESKARKFFSLY